MMYINGQVVTPVFIDDKEITEAYIHLNPDDLTTSKIKVNLGSPTDSTIIGGSNKKLTLAIGYDTDNDEAYLEVYADSYYEGKTFSSVTMQYTKLSDYE